MSFYFVKRLTRNQGFFWLLFYIKRILPYKRGKILHSVLFLIKTGRRLNSYFEAQSTLQVFNLKIFQKGVNMRYKLFGKSGLRVSEICLGTMTFGEEWDFGANKEDSKKIFDAYAKRGGNFIDTANRYTNGTSEKYVGEFIASQREHFVLATKYTLYEKTGDPNQSGNHRKNMMQSVDASLKRLNTEYIDVLYLHAWDFLSPIDEIMRAFDDLVRQGKIFYAAISDTPAWRVAQANTIADLRGLSPFVGLQVEYSLLQRTPERDLLPMSKIFDIAITAWAPIAGGALTGKYLKNK